MNQSLAMQLQYAYANDSLTHATRVAPRFFTPPDFSYKMEEWKRFATMGEVAIEFLNSYETAAERVPDFRHTLYWNARVTAERGRAGVRFFTSDMTGRYRILVEGITRSGETFSATLPLGVSPTNNR